MPVVQVMRAETFLLPLVYALWHVGLGITLPTILSIPTLLLQVRSHSHMPFV
jgi:hypothetical protein